MSNQNIIQESHIQIVLNNPLFKGLKEKEIKKLLNTDACYFRCFKSGETILKKGDESLTIEIIVKGVVEIINDKNSQKITAEEGETIGEIGAITKMPRLADVVAVVPTVTFSINLNGVKEEVLNEIWEPLAYNIFFKIRDKGDGGISHQSWKELVLLLVKILEKNE